MSFSDDQIERIAQSIQSRVSVCPICSCSVLHIYDNLVEARVVDAQRREGTGKVFLFVLVYCDRCGHAMTFSAARIGVIDT